MEASQWRSWPEIQGLQVEKLARLLNHAYALVLFYRKRFNQVGLRPPYIRTAEDLRLLPLLTKHDIQDHLEGLVSQNTDQRRVIRNNTGGSTGQLRNLKND